MKPPLSLRAAGLLIRDGKLLTVQHDHFPGCYTPGGGIEPGETSAEALIREMREETGIDFQIDRLVFVQERFYTSLAGSHHEITFFYLLKDNAVRIPDGAATDQPCERLCWLPLAGIEQVNLVPHFLRSAVTHLPQGIRHIVTDE